MKCIPSVVRRAIQGRKAHIPPVWQQPPDRILKTSLGYPETKILKRKRTPMGDKRKKKKFSVGQTSETHGQQTHRQLYHSII